MKEGKVGSLVWVKMKDGNWWPGRVLSVTEISASDHSYLASTSKVPVMLLGRNTDSVEWHKLENLRRIRSSGCGDLDDFIKEAVSSQIPVCTKGVRYAYQEYSILHALELEKQEERTMLKIPGSYRRQTRSMSAKEESISNSSEPSRRAGVKKQMSGENSNIQKGSRTPMVIMNTENSVRSRKRMRNMSNLLTENATFEEESRLYEYKSGEQSPLEVSKLSDSSCEGSHLEDSESLGFDSPSTELPHLMRTMLMDVEVTVLANHRREDVPLVSLMSKLNGKAIVGHPIETEALDDASDIVSLVKMGKSHQRLKSEKKNRMNQLVWRTYKRTPVCYISNLNACPSKGEDTEETCKISCGSTVMARKGSSSTDKALRKSQIPADFSKNDARKLTAIGEKDGLQEQKGCLKQIATCIHVNSIFSNLLRAVGRE